MNPSTTLPHVLSRSVESSDRPDSFVAAVNCIQQQVWQAFEQEIAQKQLYYHNFDHVEGVRRKAARIFQAIRPIWEAELTQQGRVDTVEYLQRMELLLDLSAIAHDLIQEFSPQSDRHTARCRESGVSEQATIDQLVSWILQLNAEIAATDPDSLALFRVEEIALVKEAIAATMCAFDPAEQSIFQPALYCLENPVSIPTRILALADIGTLGMEGLDAFNLEGGLIFLEENLDFYRLLTGGELANLRLTDPALHENIRQRLLERARFQLNFARSRVARYPLEVVGLPEQAVSILTQTVFQHIHSETLAELERSTPTAADTSLEALLMFFQYQ